MFFHSETICELFVFLPWVSCSSISYYMIMLLLLFVFARSFIHSLIKCLNFSIKKKCIWICIYLFILAVHLLNERCATSELTALYFMHNHVYFFILNIFKCMVLLLWLFNCIWLFDFLLCKALWITFMIDRLSLPYLCLAYRIHIQMINIFQITFYTYL